MSDNESGLYSEQAPTREEIDASRGALVVEFGTDWCGHCARARALIVEAFASHPSVRHLRVADGPGRRLGRSFRVKLWPTLVFLRDGAEITRVVRPASVSELEEALSRFQR